MSLLKFRSTCFFIGACFLALSTLSVGILVTAKSVSQQADAYYTPTSTYTNGDAATYYNGISDSLTDTNLLTALQNLNSTKRKSTIGYSAMGTSASSSAYIYTDYDPSTATTTNGITKGTSILSFYSGTSTTSFNREHTWPNSHGGGVVEGDIHMTRPTIASENGSRGNSFYVEGMKSSSSGWDPAMESFGIESYRGDSARIIFYCVVASSSLSLVDLSFHSTSNQNPDNMMGKLSDLLKWNLNYNVAQREQNRNEGAQYLQGNRNPFIDHPEYACKIWGNTNSTTQAICASSQTAPNTITVTPSSSSIAVGGNVTLTASVDTGSSSVTWSSSNNSIATVSNGVVTGVAAGTATITATSTLNTSIKGTATITVKSLSTLSLSGTATNKSYSAGQSFNPAGLTITATYSDSSTANVTSSVIWTPSPLTQGTTSVTGTYGGKTVSVSGLTVTASVNSGTYIIGWGTATGTDGTSTNFSSVSGSVTDLLSFSSAQNSGTNVPFYSSTDQELRLYYSSAGDGCSITIIPVEGVTFTGFVVTASSTIYTPTVKYSVNGGTTTSIPAPESSTTYNVTGLSASTSLTIQNGNTTNTQLRIKTIALTYSVAGQSEKIIDGLSASYSGGNVYVDGSLNTSSVSVTASYTDSVTYPDAILNSSDYSLSGFSSSTAGQKTVIVTYTGSLSTSSTPLTTTFNVNVVADTLTDVSVTNSNTYHPGETITKSDITVTLSYASGASNTTSNFTFASEGYQFTYADASSGGSNSSKQFSVVYGGSSYNFSVNVSRVSYSTVSDSAKALTGTEFNGSTVSKSSGTPSSTAVTIGGVNFTVTTNAYIYSSCLSFAKTAGSINNSTAFSSDLTSVSYVEKSGYRQDAILTISQDGNSWTAYSEIEIANGGYRFFKIEYTGTSTLYSNISSISFTLAGEDSATNVANYVMYEDTDNQCTTKLSEAIDKLNTMSETEKNTFWTSSDYVISTSRERLLAWATHEGKELTYSDGVFQISNSRNIASISNQSNNSLIIMVVSMFGLTAVGGFFFLRRKKEN